MMFVCIHEHLETGMRVDIKHLVLASAVECFLLLWRQGEEGDPTQDMSMLHDTVRGIYVAAEDLTKSPIVTNTFIFMCFYCEMKCAPLCHHKLCN